MASEENQKIVPMSELVKPGELLDRLLNEVIKPYAKEIAKLTARGKFVGVVFEPNELTARAARALGWDGSKPVFALPAAAVRALAMTDHVAHQWFAAKPNGMVKMFVFIHGGTLLVNCDEDSGFYIEPGSTASQLAQ